MSALDAFDLTLTDGLRAVGPLGHSPSSFCTQNNKVGGEEGGAEKGNSSRWRIS